MTQVLNGPGNGLPQPQNLYPSELYNAPYDAPSNHIGIAPGAALPIPSGSQQWLIRTGRYSGVQWLDPVTGIWRGYESTHAVLQQFSSDGVTRRIANLTGCPVGAVIAGGGSGFAQATATITANIGGSTWQPIVGGALTVSTVSTVGANYSMPPFVFIPVPPSPGVPATAHATIASGTVASVVLDDVGAGYTSAPTAVILANPTDPNFGTITQATVVLAIDSAFSGKITAALCTNNGASLSTLSALTLTAAGGAGTGATVTPVILQTVTTATVTAGGGGWGNAAAPAGITSLGGTPASVSAVGNPMVEWTKWVPRQAQISTTTSAGGGITADTIIDGGLFVGIPTAGIIGGGALPTTLASITFVMGGVFDTIMLQPL